jgi:hypothetical protein
VMSSEIRIKRGSPEGPRWGSSSCAATAGRAASDRLLGDVNEAPAAQHPRSFSGKNRAMSSGKKSKSFCPAWPSRQPQQVLARAVEGRSSTSRRPSRNHRGDVLDDRVEERVQR